MLCLSLLLSPRVSIDQIPLQKSWEGSQSDREEQGVDGDKWRITNSLANSFLSFSSYLFRMPFPTTLSKGPIANPFQLHHLFYFFHNTSMTRNHFTIHLLGYLLFASPS